MNVRKKLLSTAIAIACTANACLSGTLPFVGSAQETVRTVGTEEGYPAVTAVSTQTSALSPVVSYITEVSKVAEIQTSVVPISTSLSEMTAAETAQVTAAIPKYSIEIDEYYFENGGNIFYADQESWYKDGIRVIDEDGMEIYDPDLTFSPASPAKAYDGENTDYEVTVTYTDKDGNSAEGTFNAKIVQHGDANLDHRVDIRDASFIARYICESIYESKDELPQYADFNEDGKINVRDAAAIAKYIAASLADKTGGDKIERDNGSSESISPGMVSGTPGEIVSLPVNVTCNNNFESAAFIVQWDNVALTGSNAYGASGINLSSASGRGYCTIAAYGYNAVSDGSIATIDFQIPSNAKAGTEYEVYISAIDTFAVFGGENLADSVSVSSGKITVLPTPSETFELRRGEKMEFPEGYEGFDIVSVDETIAEVIDNVVYGISTGITELQYIINGENIFTSKMIVKESDEIEIQIDQEKYIFISDEPWNIEWETDNVSVAEVYDGVVRGISVGTAKIFAVDEETGETLYTGTVTVTEKSVTEPVLTTTAKETTTKVTTQTSVSKTSAATSKATTTPPRTTDVTTTGINGDANNDGKLNVRDAAFIATSVVREISLPDWVDFNGDGVVNIRDSAAIARYLATGKIGSGESGTGEGSNDSGSGHAISIGSVAGRPGETVSVPVNVTCNDNLESLFFTLKWNDKSLMSLDNAYGYSGLIANSYSGDGFCRIAAFGSNHVSDGDVVTIEFTIPEDATPGTEYEIYFSAIGTFAEFLGEDYADTVDVSGGTITVIPDVPETIEINEGDTIEFSEGYEVFDVVSDKPSIADFKNDTLYGVSAGKTKLHFTMSDGTVFTSEVTVMASVNVELKVDEEKYIFTSCYDGDLKWISNDNSIASFEDGVLRGISTGKTIVYGIDTTNGKTVYSGLITVTEKPVTTAVTTTDGGTTKTSVTTTGTICISEPAEAEADYADKDMPTPSVYLSKVRGNAGEIVGMPLKVKCDNNFGSLDMTLSWEDTTLSMYYLDCTDDISCNYEIGEGNCSLVVYGSSAIADGTVATIYFEIPENAKNGTEYDINISSLNGFGMYDSGEDITDTVSAYSGKITVSNEYETIDIMEGESFVLTGDIAEFPEIDIDDTSVVTIEDNVLCGISSGSTSVIFNGEKKSFTLYVNVITPSEFELELYDGKKLYVSDGWYGLKWMSSDASIANVSSYYYNSGYVYGESEGTATIYAVNTSTGEIVYTGTVTVKGEEPYDRGTSYDAYLYYRIIDEDKDGEYDYVEISDCEGTAVSVEIPDEIEGLPVTSIGNAAFQDCSNLESIIIPDSVTNIGGAAFYNCSSLAGIKIPESVKFIGDDAFVDCTSLESIVIPDGVTSIASWTFAGCSKLSDVTIPNSVTSIEYDAFCGCSDLKNITIPDSVESIGPYAFYCCSGLENITIENPECDIDDGTGYVICSGTTDDSGDPYFNGVIYGYDNSTAQEYAEKYGYKFALIEAPVTSPAVTTTVTTSSTTVSSSVSVPAGSTTNKEEGSVTTSETTGAPSTTGPAATSDIPKNTTTAPVSDPGTTTTAPDPGSTQPGVLKGDANRDGKVNVRDAAFIALMLAQGKENELPACADYNEDNKINVRDAAAIAKFLASGGK